MQLELEIGKVLEGEVVLLLKGKLKAILLQIIFMLLQKKTSLDIKFAKIIKMEIKIENIHFIFADTLFVQQYLLRTFLWITKKI